MTSEEQYWPSEEYGKDDAEEYAWELEYRLKCERSASHVYVPTNFSDCFESSIMGRDSCTAGVPQRELESYKFYSNG